MRITAHNGDVFEAGQELLDVTRRHRPDTSWVFSDSHGHEHRWHTAGQPAMSYSPSATYDTPSLVSVHDDWGYYEDGDRYEIAHNECRQCGEHIEPRYTTDTTRQHIAGLRWYQINGEPVSPAEFKQRVESLKQ